MTPEQIERLIEAMERAASPGKMSVFVDKHYTGRASNAWIEPWWPTHSVDRSEFWIGEIFRCPWGWRFDGLFPDRSTDLTDVSSESAILRQLAIALRGEHWISVPDDEESET